MTTQPADYLLRVIAHGSLNVKISTTVDVGLARGVMRYCTAVKSYACVSTWLLSCDCQICDLRTLRLQHVRQVAAETRSAREDRGPKWTDDAAPMRELERKQIRCGSVHFTDMPVRCRAINAYPPRPHSLREVSRRPVREAVRSRAIAAKAESAEACQPITSVALSIPGERDAD